MFALQGRILIATGKRPPRKKPLPTTEAAVLINSARRCPLCFHLHGDLTLKLGQIAHLDGDRTNGAEDNLTWLCMPHHSEYDSTTSQHKNYTIGELKEMRRRLYVAIDEKQHLNTAAKKSVDAHTRALVLIDRDDLKDKIQAPYLPTDEQLMIEQRMPHCILLFKNFGKTSATITASRVELEISDNPNVPPHSPAYDSPETMIPYIIPPDGSIPVEARMNSTTRMMQDCADIKKGLRSLWLCGIVKYVDLGRGRDGEHETRFCYVWEIRMNTPAPFWSMKGDANYNNVT